MENLSRFEAPQASPDSPAPGLDLDLLGVGVRRCVGDGQVWSWYRGSSVGPRPCTSALLAVERFADHLVDALGLPLREVTELLLRDSPARRYGNDRLTNAAPFRARVPHRCQELRLSRERMR